MGQVKKLRSALHAAEVVLGSVVEQYRLALGCCFYCGDFFRPGDLAVAMVDEKGRICFEHDLCPRDAVNVRTTYRNDQQDDLLR